MMINSISIIPILASFFVALFMIPRWMKRARKANLVGKDIHKFKNIELPESGGIAVVTGFALGSLLYIALSTFILNTTENFIELFALLSTTLLITFIAFVDDILGWKIGLRKRTRLILVTLASIPLIVINVGISKVSLPFLGVIELGLIYPLVVIPLGIVGAATTFNFLAGFNGLEAGQGILLMLALGIVAFFTGSPWITIIAFSMAAALLAFLFYNFYPAKVFPGDSLTYAVGGLIAVISIIGNFEKVAIWFFIPYIIETGLKLRGKLIKQSFGKPLRDGTLDLKYEKIYGLTHLSIYIMKKNGMESDREESCIFYMDISNFNNFIRIYNI